MKVFFANSNFNIWSTRHKKFSVDWFCIIELTSAFYTRFNLEISINPNSHIASSFNWQLSSMRLLRLGLLLALASGFAAICIYITGLSDPSVCMSVFIQCILSYPNSITLFFWITFNVIIDCRSQLSPHWWRSRIVAFASQFFPEMCGKVSL